MEVVKIAKRNLNFSKTKKTPFNITHINNCAQNIMNYSKFYIVFSKTSGIYVCDDV